jgi:hypothetical protein
MRSLDGPVAELRAIIGALDAEIGDLPSVELGDHLVEIKRAIDRLEAVFAHGLRRVDRAGDLARDGALTSAAWLRHACRFSGAAAAQRVDLARRLEELPETDAALSAGAISLQHAALVARTAGEIGAEQVRRAEPTLMEAARKLDPGQFAVVTRHLRHCVDPDGFLGDANREHERRYLSLGQSLDGVVFLEGALDAEGGATLQTALDALMTVAAGDPRSARQRRADALVMLARGALDGGGLPRVGGRLPHLSLTASVELLAGLPGQAAGHLEWSLPIPLETVRRLACDVALTTVLVDHDGEPLDVGRSRRLVPAPLRTALALRDGGCRFPGCDRPVAWTDAHHIRHWAAGGETVLGNLILLCRRHHRTVHEEEWRIAWDEEGRPVAIPPPRLSHLFGPLSAHGPPTA